MPDYIRDTWATRRAGLPRAGAVAEAQDLLVELIGAEQAAGLRVQDTDPRALERAGVDELRALFGLSGRTARRVHAALGLARRLRELAAPARPSVRSPRGVLRLLDEEVRGLEREHFYVLLLDGKHGLRRRELISVGTLTTSLVHPREVFRAAVREAAAAIVCAHNHPSGDPEPSNEDLEVTRRLLDAGRLLGIPLLDHVVLGDDRALSLRERMGF